MDGEGHQRTAPSLGTWPASPSESSKGRSRWAIARHGRLLKAAPGPQHTKSSSRALAILNCVKKLFSCSRLSSLSQRITCTSDANSPQQKGTTGLTAYG